MWMDSWVLNTPVSAWPKYHNIPILFRFFETQKTCVVLANSNVSKTEVNEEACLVENVPILRRKGGGGTVALMPGCLVLTFAFFGKSTFQNAEYFEFINLLWCKALSNLGFAGVETNGISDLAFHNKKIAGTSMFRKKHLAVYQGSLLVEPNFASISKLLKHPSKEPSYREGRSHEDFLTSLKKEFPEHLNFSTSTLAELCTQEFYKLLQNSQELAKLALTFESL